MTSLLFSSASATPHRITDRIGRALKSRPRLTVFDRSARPHGPSLGGDRRGSNPRTSKPESADTRFRELHHVAGSAYLSRFLCRLLPTVSACCAPGGVSGGVSPPPSGGGIVMHPPRMFWWALNIVRVISRACPSPGRFVRDPATVLGRTLTFHALGCIKVLASSGRSQERGSVAIERVLPSGSLK